MSEMSALFDRYVVFGHPISHSKSPFIHAEFARQTGQPMKYETCLAPLDGFAMAVRDFFGNGGAGANVTVPFKLEAHDLVDKLSPRAALAGAVNTLYRDGDCIVGDNTDGAGLVRDIEQNLHVALGGKRILLLGAGGAARGALLSLLQCAPAQLCIANRSVDKALELQALASARHDMGNRCTALSLVSLKDYEGPHFDVVINATSSSLQQSSLELSPAIFASTTLAYDMMYGAEPTPFMHMANQCGARTCDGLGMLVEQAAEAFYIWRGVRPETAAVLAHLRGAL